MFVLWNAVAAMLLVIITSDQFRAPTVGKPRYLLSALVAASPLAAAFGGAPLLLTMALPALVLVWEKRAGRTIVVMLCLYTLALVPLLRNGHFAHGTAGSYTSGECADRTDALSAAALRYAAANGGVLPIGRSSDDVLPAIRPFLRRRSWAAPDSPVPLACPLGEVFRGDTRPLQWNAALSGARVADLLLQAKPPALFSCPYLNIEQHFHSRPTSITELSRNLGPLGAPVAAPSRRATSWLGLRGDQSLSATPAPTQ